ncbi:MAG: alpha/beta hydrolase [Betaproteobacteria bacterium RIFCSPLOWO2_12_FULL_63_13]|nr:MAG: alpha/beta hydrolase [Betaproteobacteria bacterium RIFCSPLOWO2_12_FULL_63_13]
MRLQMKSSDSVYLAIRGLTYHCRCWGAPGQAKLFLLHGWMDVSASFQFMVDAFRHPWHVIAPDWRGYGLSSRGGGDCYWIPDFLADLDAILEHFQPTEPVLLAGHSMGGNVATMYAGVRPQRVARLVNMEGFGLVDSRPEDAPRRYARWLDQIRSGARLRDYGSFGELAEKLRANNDRLTHERALFLARHWGAATETGRIELRADPGHKLINPVLYRLEEAKACWRAVTAPVLWMQGESSQNASALRMSVSDRDGRKACFSNLIDRVIPASGHAIHHDQPELAAAIIEDFLLGALN